jgi:hypothetical protein
MAKWRIGASAREAIVGDRFLDALRRRGYVPGCEKHTAGDDHGKKQDNDILGQAILLANLMGEFEIQGAYHDNLRSRRTSRE